MRFPRVKADGQGYYPCVSRVVEGRFIFQTSADGSVEAERFIKLMRRLEAFSGVRFLTYVLMSNHFHLLCERFKSVLLEGGKALAAVAAYIELNPVRAGLCADPKDYRYCGYAEALAKGSLLARQGIRTILGQPETICRKELSRQYRKYLFVKGSSRSANKPPAFDLATAQRVVEEQNGELPLPQHLLCRIRYFTDGVILGSEGFVESHFGRLKQKLGYKRHRTATRLTALGSLRPSGPSAISWSGRPIRFLPIPSTTQPAAIYYFPHFWSVCSLKQSGAPSLARGRLLIRFPDKSSLSYSTCPSSPTKKSG